MKTNEPRKGQTLTLKYNGETHEWKVISENKSTYTIQRGWTGKSGRECYEVRYLHKATGKISK